MKIGIITKDLAFPEPRTFWEEHEWRTAAKKILKIKPEYDPEFVFQNTLGVPYEKYIQITSQRSGQPGVNAQEYAEYTFLVPEYLEQKKIGGFLHQMDNLITLQQRKLEKLKNIKKSMLEKMFV